MNYFSVHAEHVHTKYFNIDNSTFTFLIYFHSFDCQKFNIIDCKCTTESGATFNADTACDSKCFPIEAVKSFKYLGITLDQNMSWTQHISELKTYLRSSTRSFYRLKKFCSLQTLKTVYHALFHSKLQYGISCWGSAYNINLKPLAILQKYAIRRISNAHRLAHSMVIFRSLKILPVKHLFYFRVSKIFFMRGGYFQSPIFDTSRNLRSLTRHVVDVPVFRTTHYRNSYPVVSFKLFNRLPLELRMIRSQSIFEKKVKLWLLGFDHDEIEVFLTYIA